MKQSRTGLSVVDLIIQDVKIIILNLSFIRVASKLSLLLGFLRYNAHTFQKKTTNVEEKSHQNMNHQEENRQCNFPTLEAHELNFSSHH